MLGATKKLDRLLTRGKEMIGQEVKTNTTDDFKQLEAEMNLRHEGMDKIHKSMNNYVKNVQKRSETDDREKLLPVGYLGATMISHGQDFQPDSEFGNCLLSFGRAQEALARKQETYGVNASTTWLESLERSLAQMKEYQAARKKLEQRRVAYDTSLSKMQKQKREDFRVEEELRAQKAKYEEASEDVYRRMEDIREAESESVADLTAFLDAELAYYDSCREVLLQLKRDWPASQGRGTSDHKRISRSRSNTAHSYADRFNSVEEEPAPAPKLTIPRVSSRTASPGRDTYDSPRPTYARSVTSDSVSQSSRDYSPVGMPRLTRVPTEPSGILARTALRPVRRDDDAASDRYFNGGSESPTGSIGSRQTSWGADGPQSTKKAPPPPPPSRSKKPPPPPPAKRSALSTSELP